MTPYYDEDGITIYHGDCREVLPELAPLDVIITDPPYGAGKLYGDSYDDSDGPEYWAWFQGVLTSMRAASSLVVFTHRVAALRHLDDWDWVYVWNKPRASSGLHWLPVMPHWEPIFAYGIGGRGLGDLPRRFDVLHCNPIRGEHGHPVPKPVPLFAELIRMFAPTNETVVDPFMGSGTTLRAAKDERQNAIGIEIEEKYCEIAVQRLAQGVLEFQ